MSRILNRLFLAVGIFSLLSCGCAKTAGKQEVLQSIYIAKTQLSLNIGESYKLDARPVPSMAVPPVWQWSSGDGKVATVSSEGLVTAVGAGTTEVVASYGKHKASVSVSVAAPDDIPAEGKVFNVTLEGADCSFADFAEYGVFVPGGESPISGVLVLQHGCGMEQFGITRPYDLQYQAFARKWNLAVVETALHGNCGIWHHPESGSAAALMKVLVNVGNRSGHEELGEAPWLLFGHSSGGHWVLAMLRDYPERIIAAVCYSAAWDPQWEYDTVAAKVPLLLRHAGPEDAPFANCQGTASHTFRKLRAMDAPVSLVYNVGQNHNLSYIRHMAIPFYEAALRQRLPSEAGGELRDLDPSLCCLADTTSFEIIRESDYAEDNSSVSGGKQAMCRFPDMECALKWKEYATTNDVADITAPDAPYALATENLAGGSVRLSWKAEADIESGISCFRVYANGILKARIPETGMYQTFDPNGDNTIPAHPQAMEAVLSGLSSSGAVLEVETVNGAGLASERTSLRMQ
ncbi:MAG: Ig-like domain-containing protein [Bacteroidales bacterium]|nr:Ig-like domain-containing protein [Bacteroidales bacterium]